MLMMRINQFDIAPGDSISRPRVFGSVFEGISYDAGPRRGAGKDVGFEAGVLAV